MSEIKAARRLFVPPVERSEEEISNSLNRRKKLPMECGGTELPTEHSSL